jgi:hypothetical protein
MTAATEQSPRRRRLDLGWKLMVAFGAHWVLLSILMPLASVLALPGQPQTTFAVGDERFTGISWTQIGALGPNLGLWLVLTKVSMSAMMCGLAILIVALAYRPYRRGERWAWRALVAATFIPIFVYYGPICAIHVSHGLPIWKSRPGSSGVMADLVNVFVLVWLYFGLWYPRRDVTS